MKRKLRALLLVLAGMLCSTSLFAEDFEVDGIYYKITSQADNTVAVTYRGNYDYDYSNEYSGDVKIPESVTYSGNTYSVTSIGSSAFYDCRSLTSVVIGNSVTSIGSGAFQSCTSLTSVEIGNSVTSIGEWAFYDCSSLTSVEIPNSVTNIGDYAFDHCYSLSSVELPNSVTSIGNQAFGGCSSLTSVEIPNSVTSIGSNAFYGTAWYNNQPDGVIYLGKVLYKYKGTMPANTSITIEDGTVSISPEAFYNCYSLTSVEIPNSVTSIGQSAFSNCRGLNSVTIGNSVTSIGDHAFFWCSSLTSVEIPNSVTSIGSSAFDDTAWYNNQSDGVIYAGKVLYKYKGTMPANTSITIEDGTVSISPSAFSNCSSLTSVEFPNSVTSIGDYAFRYCENLKKLISYAEVPPVCGYPVFDGVNKQECTLQVPEKSISAYQQADQWNEFFLIEGMPTAIGGVTVDGAVPATADVYSTNGMLIKRNADLKNLKHVLPAGVYIIGGKKVYVR